MDVTEVEGRYGEGAARRTPRWLWWLLAALLVVVVVGAVHAALHGELVRLLVNLLSPVTVTTLFALRSPRTTVTSEGLEVRRYLSTERLPWSQVASVRPQGRWDVHGAALRTTGERVDLPWVPQEVLEVLAERLGGDPVDGTPHRRG